MAEAPFSISKKNINNNDSFTYSHFCLDLLITKAADQCNIQSLVWSTSLSVTTPKTLLTATEYYWGCTSVYCSIVFPLPVLKNSYLISKKSITLEFPFSKLSFQMTFGHLSLLKYLHTTTIIIQRHTCFTITWDTKYKRQFLQIPAIFPLTLETLFRSPSQGVSLDYTNLWSHTAQLSQHL